MTIHLGRRAILQAMGAASLVGCAARTAERGGVATGWATGGTAAMKGGYADPFAAGTLASACTLTCAATVGPCHAKTLSRKDISEGQPGLPVRLAFLVVDEQCRPVPDALVDVWHAGPAGMYSGDDAEPMCTLEAPEALAARWFRGTRTSDANGRVDFDTCFPGWYHGRTVHVHFTVTTRDGHGVTSQLFFDDALVDSVVAREPGYARRGRRDTNNTNDGVIGTDEVRQYLFATSRQHDGAMLAAKAIVLQTHGSTCAAKGRVRSRPSSPASPAGLLRAGPSPTGPPPSGSPPARE